MKITRSWVISVIGIPKPQARPRTFWRRNASKPVTWSQKTSWYQLVYAEALSNRPNLPLEGPLGVELVFRMPKPKSMKGKDVCWHITRPDKDNLEKGIFDALTQAQVWRDDSLVCESFCQKIYAMPGFEPGMTITVKKL